MCVLFIGGIIVKPKGKGFCRWFYGTGSEIYLKVTFEAVTIQLFSDPAPITKPVQTAFVVEKEAS